MTRRATVATIALGVACGPILCCWIAFASCCCPRRLRHHGESEDKRRFERRQAVAPRPLPIRPPERALTMRGGKCTEDEAPKPEAPRGAIVDQLASRLMQLPLELRQMIYRDAIGDSAMHIVLKKYRLGHIRCKASDLRECALDYDGCLPGNMWSVDSDLPDEPPPTDADILPLLSTCRQMYIMPVVKINWTELTWYQIL